MSALKNARHEAFAQALAKGQPASEAYVTAGYKSSRSAASRLSTNVNVEARVRELVRVGAEKATIDIARTLQELVRVGLSDVRRLFDENGNLKSVYELDDEIAAAVASVEVVKKPGTRDEDGESDHVHKIRLWDKNTALDKIAKHLGMLTEKHEHSVSDPLAELMREVSGRSFRPVEKPTV